VTANEVRKKLAQHYLAENGSYHPVRIGLPPGSYSAEFKWEPPAVEAPAAETPSVETTAADTPPAQTPPAQMPPAETHLPARPNWLSHRMIAGTAAVLVLAGAFAGAGGQWILRRSMPSPHPSLTRVPQRQRPSKIFG
jgi:hypothetical protein